MLRTRFFVASSIMLTIGAALIFLLVKSDHSTAYPFMPEQAIPQGEAIWEIDNSPAKALELNTFRISLRDLAGEPITDASLRMQLDMIGMVCGDYSFALTESSPGVYEGEGMPLMAGRWKADLTIAHPAFETIELSNAFKAVYD
ncbi:FixH family protein [Paenibacillus sp. J5C_2022]|uniref:FixH family protein n=1 Tax=Paenibacillus sp. J5C2022 TaxID=2977129 RepID=UPI0021D193D7|nr:FixH family protein [Paenibacillus sp. J5C2022]MCU6707212.1 FixH family protein [Paenibacillus sp. J5C2022]